MSTSEEREVWCEFEQKVQNHVCRTVERASSTAVSLLDVQERQQVLYTRVACDREINKSRGKLIAFFFYDNYSNKSNVKLTCLFVSQNVEEISHQQLVRKFFLVDNISGFKALSTSSGFTRSSELSVLRYMRSLTVL